MIRSNDDYHLVITAESVGEYSVCGSEYDGRTLYNCASHGIELLDSYFGRRNLGAARKIDTMFYVTADVHYYEEWDDNRTVENFIVSYPFSTREEAETRKASLEQRKEVKNFVSEFLPPGLDIDYVDGFEVVGPKV